MKQLTHLASFFGLASIAGALELAYPFGDHMVLQREHQIPVWGTAEPQTDVAVSFSGNTVQGKAGADGKWQVNLPAMEANAKPQTIVVNGGGKTVSVDDVLVGDVWYASGQSNMAWKLRQCEGGADAIAKSADEGLRLFNHAGGLHPGSKKYTVDYLKQMSPENYYQTEGWQVSGPQTTSNMSGVAYFFGQKLRDELKVPIGVVNVSVGGTPIEAHIAPKQFKSDRELAPLLKDWWKNPEYPVWCRGRAAHNLTHWFADPKLKGQAPPHPFTPMFLWNAGPERFQPLPIKGVIWYQGESNAGKDGSPGSAVDGTLNKKKFKLLVESWRDGWNQQELPVYYVQLPGLNRKWPVFREMQLQASKEIPHVGMAVTMDVGHPTNVHPNKKQPVGERLALLALDKTYGKELVSEGPIYKRHTIKGDAVYLDFESGAGMKACEGGAIVGFEVAGIDKKFYPATAKVDGEYLVVKSAKVKRPVAVRYAWDNDPVCNLVNAVGLPASPFRTDTWKEVEPSGHLNKKNAAALVVPAKRSNKIRVACIGDSITYGAGIKDRGMTYPAQLQKLLGDKYEVRNFGNSGRGVIKKSKRGRGPRAYLFMKEHKEALAFEPQIVVCNLGINDIMDFDRYGDDFVPDYKELLESYKTLDSYPRVIIWKDLAPLFKGQKFFGDARVGKINEAIGKVAKEMQIETIDMAKPFAGKGAMFPDHIHPNADGAAVIAREVYQMIKQ
ncbi:GDSL-type esterase/lipase family protein [Rubritalea tangerina]|uniref:GDSL-type esterase/lipase family protein n=1 Tax=Rubritalea tangerina TaxID=430798 RepID=UPI00360A1B28